MAVGAAGIVGVCGLAYLAVADPHDPSVPMPLCPTKLVTHLDCPACGGLRMVASLLRGDFARAVRDNAFLLVALPVALVLFGRWAWAGWRGEIWRLPARLAWGFLGVALGWMLVRNLPGWPWRPT